MNYCRNICLQIPQVSYRYGYKSGAKFCRQCDRLMMQPDSIFCLCCGTNLRSKPVRTTPRHAR